MAIHEDPTSFYNKAVIKTEVHLKTLVPILIGVGGILKLLQTGYSFCLLPIFSMYILLKIVEEIKEKLRVRDGIDDESDENSDDTKDLTDKSLKDSVKSKIKKQLKKKYCCYNCFCLRAYSKY